MNDGLQTLLLGATLVASAFTCWMVRDTASLARFMEERTYQNNEYEEIALMTVTETWTSGGAEVRVTTVRGVASPGDGDVPNDETVAAWRARHLARVAEAKSPENGFPPDP